MGSAALNFSFELRAEWFGQFVFEICYKIWEKPIKAREGPKTHTFVQGFQDGWAKIAPGLLEEIRRSPMGRKRAWHIDSHLQLKHF